MLNPPLFAFLGFTLSVYWIRPIVLDCLTDIELSVFVEELSFIHVRNEVCCVSERELVVR